MLPWVPNPVCAQTVVSLLSTRQPSPGLQPELVTGLHDAVKFPQYPEVHWPEQH